LGRELKIRKTSVLFEIGFRMSELLTAQESSIRNTPFFQYIPWLTLPFKEARSLLANIPPHLLSFLATLEEQNTVALMQKDVTLHS